MTEHLADFVSDNDNDSVGLEPLRFRLEFFFMDPMKKWRESNRRPWKLLIQILKIVAFTIQLVLFGSDMAKFIDYKEEMQLTMKQLLLKDWDPSADAVAYPGPYVPYAVYTEYDFFHSVNYAIHEYSNITRVSVGPFGYQSNVTDVVSPIDVCVTNFAQADFDPTMFNYNYSIYTVMTCKTIEDFAPPGSELWLDFDIRGHLKEPINFSSLVSVSLRLPLRTLLIEDATTGDSEVVCFDLDTEIFYDNRHRNGQIIISLVGNPKRAECVGKLMEDYRYFAIRRLLNYSVIIFCLISLVLCIRSIIRAIRLLLKTQRTLATYGKILESSDKIEFIDFWLILIIMTDLMVGYATIIITFSDNHLLETDNYTVCSLLLGLGNLLSWAGLLRYLSYFQKYNLLIVTLRKSFVHVMRFMLCTTIIYCGFCFCGWIVFGPYHFKFRQLSTTTECLFSLINGDDMFETFALLRSDIVSIWWFSRIYLYLFVSLFIYVVLSLFIALIMDAYEMIKTYTNDGFPKSRLELFYLEGDITKLASLTTGYQPANGRDLIL